MSDMDLVPLDRLIPWFDANGVGSGPVESVRLLTGGTQNVLLRFVRGDRAYVLRRPPREVLFPLDSRRRLAADIVHHPVDPLDIVDDLIGDIRQEGIREMRPIGRHPIYRGHRAQGYRELVGALITHDPYTLYR